MTKNTEYQHPKSSPLRCLAALPLVAVLGSVMIVAGMNVPEWAAPAQASASAARPVGFADVVARVKPAVISLRVKIVKTQQTVSSDSIPGTPSLQKFHDSGAHGAPGEIMMGEGSAFFISPDGYAVTNNHVVDHAEFIEVTTNDGKSYEAKVVGTDSKTDLALIKVDGPDFPYVKFADGQPHVGDWVIAIGNPYGLGGTVTAGIVSAEGRDIGAGPYDDFIQIDASINRGNSGGPAFDLNGEVIGVNTAIFSPSEGSVGIGFDIPAATAEAVIAQLKDKGYMTRGWLGVQQQQVTADIAEGLGIKQAKGTLVDEAEPAGPAAKAGIKPRDVITAVDGVAINDPRELAQKVGGLAPGTSVVLSVLRDGEPRELTLRLGAMPAERHTPVETKTSSSATPPNEQNLGLSLAANHVGLSGKNGVKVVAIDPNGAAAEHGLQAGDIILDVGGKAVSNPNDVQRDLASLRKSGKQAALIGIQSGDASKFVALPLGQE